MSDTATTTLPVKIAILSRRNVQARIIKRVVPRLS